jgi:hypothetical protein
MKSHDSELNELNFLRMRALEEALQRAEAGVATKADWVVIRTECGMPEGHFFSSTKGNSYVSNSV